MTDGAVHEMSRILGGLQSDVKAFKDSLDYLNRTWGERERDAVAGRRVLHEKMEEIGKDFTRLEAQVENVSKDLNVIKPAIDEFKSARDQQDGAQKNGRRTWAAFLAIAGIAAGGAVEVFHRLFPH